MILLHSSSSHRAWLGITLLLVTFLAAACTDSSSEEEIRRQREEEARKLASLPYVTQSPVRQENRGLKGVVHHDEHRAVSGMNLYGSLSKVGAVLRNMDGEIVHEWSAEGVFPDREDFPLGTDVLDIINGPFSPGLMVAELHDGHLFGIESHVGMVKLDRDSKVIWSLPNVAHHDLDMAADGSILVLSAIPRTIDTNSGKILIIDDVIQHLAADGSLQREFSIFRILAADPEIQPLLSESLNFARYWFQNLDEWRETHASQKPATREAYRAMMDLYHEVFVAGTRSLRPSHQLFVLYMTPADFIHTNTLQLLPAHPTGLWQEGNVLVSMRELDLVAVLDLAQEKVVWWWGPGELSRQHQPSLLPDGTILLFDNGTERGKSRVIIVDPASREIVWSYEGAPGTDFFCGAMGGAQGLPGGNILITDSGEGRAFEIDREGLIVWDFFNPVRGHNPFEDGLGGETIEAIYRVGRIEGSEFIQDVNTVR